MVDAMSAPRFWVARCNAADAAALWPEALKYLAPAIARSGGLYEPEDVEHLVTRPEAGTPRGWSLWLIAEQDKLLGAWVTRVEHYPRGRILETIFGGGADIDAWWNTSVAEMDKWAAECGCGRHRCYGRRGFARLGMRQIGFILERKVAA
jgi:hypothetical protein